MASTIGTSALPIALRIRRIEMAAIDRIGVRDAAGIEEMHAASPWRAWHSDRQASSTPRSRGPRDRGKISSSVLHNGGGDMIRICGSLQFVVVGIMLHDLDEPAHAERRIESAAAGREFEVVGAEHDDHEIERLVRSTA